MDEASACLDQKTKSIILKANDRYFKNNTLFSIAYRIETILNFELIMVFDEGKLKELDKPSELLKQKNSIFFKLYYEENESK